MSTSGNNAQKETVSEEMLILDRAQRLGLVLTFHMRTSEFYESAQLPFAPQMQEAGATCG